MPNRCEATTDNYLIGVGIADVTGEPGGVGMMGYAMPQQRTAGVHQRQWARAFVVAEEEAPEHRVVFVVADLGMIFTGVHQAVLQRLRGLAGDRYGPSNTVLTATHTHSGPGGFSHHTLYNITVGGFRPKTFEAIVDGIVTSIVRADADVAPGSICWNTGDVHGASVNRALPAFQNNPAQDRGEFPAAVDPSMTVLRFERAGEPVGVLSWFATHGTSMPNTNRLISGDNKGFAAYRWEHDWAGRSALDKAAGASGFVAGFAQGNAGDMSPNLGAGDSYGPANNEFLNTRVIGDRQALRARELFDTATRRVTGPVDHRQRYVDFSHVHLDEPFARPGLDRTWPALLGQAFMSGCYDGRGMPHIRQGDLNQAPLSRLIERLARTSLAGMARTPPDVRAGHAPKPGTLATGLCTPPWTPQILPLQIIRIGQLAIVAGPGEFTITAGLRIRRTVAAALGPAVEQVVFSGYANAYSGYITTPEEYAVQLYEGGSTHFGPATLPAYQQEFERIAQALRSGEPTPSASEPPDLSGHVWSTPASRRGLDHPGPGRCFGQVLREPEPRYAPGDRLEVRFVSANPNRLLHPKGSYVSIQMDAPSGWHAIADDDDWRTLFRWRRNLAGVSIATVRWAIPPETQPGLYRVTHQGQANTRTGRLDFIGTSRVFEIVPAPAKPTTLKMATP